MADRYDVLTVRESNGKSWFTKLGSMFANRNGDGFTVLLDAMPAPTEGQYKLIVKPPQDRDQRQPSQAAREGHRSEARKPNYDDDLDPPF